MQALLDRISHGPESELGTLIYGFAEASPGAQEVLLGIIRPLRAPIRTANADMPILDSHEPTPCHRSHNF